MRRPRCGVWVADHTVSRSSQRRSSRAPRASPSACRSRDASRISSSNTCAALRTRRRRRRMPSAAQRRRCRRCRRARRRAGLHRVAAVGAPPAGRRSRRTSAAASSARPAVGDHHRDRLPDVADLVAREAVLGAHDADRRVGHQVRDALARIGSGRSAAVSTAWTPGMRAAPPRIDRADLGVAMRAAHEAGVAARRAARMSSTKRPRPASSAGSSNRVTRAPNCFTPMWLVLRNAAAATIGQNRVSAGPDGKGRASAGWPAYG